MMSFTYLHFYLLILSFLSIVGSLLLIIFVSKFGVNNVITEIRRALK